MNLSKIRITTVNNSDARDFQVLSGIRSVWVRHNGGKTVIATCHTSDLSDVKTLLDESQMVYSYKVEDNTVL